MEWRGSPRAALVWQDYRAVVRLDCDGQRETWLLTPFEQRRGPGGAGGEPPAPPYTPAGRVIDRPEGAGPPQSDLPPGPRRFKFKAYAPTGLAVLMETRAVELDALIPSHGPDGRANPAYPHGEGIQPRDATAPRPRTWIAATSADCCNSPCSRQTSSRRSSKDGRQRG
jgi:hypothetical protein